MQAFSDCWIDSIFVFLQSSCAITESHQQEGAQKLCSATLSATYKFHSLSCDVQHKHTSKRIKRRLTEESQNRWIKWKVGFSWLFNGQIFHQTVWSCYLPELFCMHLVFKMLVWLIREALCSFVNKGHPFSMEIIFQLFRQQFFSGPRLREAK